MIELTLRLSSFVIFLSEFAQLVWRPRWFVSFLLIKKGSFLLLCHYIHFGKFFILFSEYYQYSTTTLFFLFLLSDRWKWKNSSEASTLTWRLLTIKPLCDFNTMSWQGENLKNFYILFLIVIYECLANILSLYWPKWIFGWGGNRHS